MINGFYRDTPMVLEQHWPVFGRERFAQDSSVRTQVADYRCTIEMEGVWVVPGDLIFGDLDGVLVVPKKAEKQVVLHQQSKGRKIGEKRNREWHVIHRGVLKVWHFINHLTPTYEGSNWSVSAHVK